MQAIRDIKSDLRGEYRKMRLGISDDERARLDAEICRAFISSASFGYYDVILLFAASDGEPDISDIARAALASGKRIAFPKCAPKGKMTFRYVSSLDELKPGMFGIREPSEDAPEFDPSGCECAVCLIPGVVFDKRGYRVGYGKGYYDRFLSSFNGSSMGIVYSFCVTDRVPSGKYDAKLPVLLTERGVMLTC